MRAATLHRRVARAARLTARRTHHEEFRIAPIQTRVKARLLELRQPQAYAAGNQQRVRESRGRV